MKVLVLSGNAYKNEPIFERLGDMGAEVVHEKMCRKAIERIETDIEIEVVVVMTSARDDDALKLVRNLRMDRRLKLLPIILVGNEFDDSQVRTYRDLNVSDILVLPGDKNAFESRVRSAALLCRKTVLVVDDEPAIRDILEQFLRFERFRPLTATSVVEAWDIMKRESVDIVVTDIMLEGKTGIDLLKCVKADYPQVPVIFITGQGGKYSSKDILAMGADGFFAKPFKNTELMYKLHECLDRSSSRAKTKAAAG